MPKIPRSLPIEQVDYIASTLKTRELPKTVFRKLDMILRLTHTNGLTPSVTLQGLLNQIGKVDLVLNGQDNIMSFPFYWLYYENAYDFSVEPDYTLFTTASTQGESKIAVTLPFSLIRGVSKNDTMLDARGLSSINLGINFNANQFTGAPIDNGYVALQSTEYANVTEKAPARHELAYDSVSITKTGTIQIDLETKGTNQYYRLWLFAKDSTGAMSNGVIDNIEVKSRNFSFIDETAEYLQYKNKKMYAVPISQTGVYVIDFTTDGRMSERLDARALSELTLDVNAIASGGTLDIIKEKVVFG